MKKDNEKDHIRTTVWLPRELHAIVRKFAFDNNISLSEAVRESLKKYILKEEKVQKRDK